MRHYIYRVFVVIVIFLTSVSVASAFEKGFSRVALPFYVPTNHINNAITDVDGLMWLATNNGLIRFGSSSEIVIYDSENVNALKSDHIQVLFIDSEGLFWIGTRRGGLTTYNKKTDVWKNYMNSPENPNSISNDEILCIYEDVQGRLWIGTESGLNLYDSESDSFTQFLHDPNDNTSISNKAVLCIYQDSYENFWIGTWAGGLNIMDENKNNIAESTFRRINIGNNNIQKKASIWSIAQDSMGVFWFGTHFSGLYYAKQSEQEVALLRSEDDLPFQRNFQHDPIVKGSISSELHIGNIVIDDQKNLWIPTSHGLNMLSVENRKLLEEDINADITFEKFFYDSNNNSSIPNNVIVQLFKDKNGYVWIATENGIAYINEQKSIVESYPVESNADKISNVADFFFAPNDKLIIGITENYQGASYGKIGLYDYNTSEIYPLNEEYPFIPKINCFKSLNSINRNEFLILQNKAITHVNFETNTAKELKLSPRILELIESQPLRSTVKDSKNRLWLGFDGALIMFHLDNNQMVEFTTGENENFLSDISITALVIDKNEDIWVATYNGLNRITENDGQFTCDHFLHNAVDSTSIPTNRIISLLHVDGSLYMSASNSILTYDISEDRFSKVSLDYKSDIVSKIVNRKPHEIIAKSKSKVLYLDIKEDKYYIIRDELFGTSHGDAYCDGNQYLFIGGTKNFIKLDISKMKEALKYPIALIPDVKIYNDQGSVLINCQSKDELTLDSDVYRTEISFCSDNLINLNYNQYAYRLLGFEEDWVYTNNNKPIAYTNLSQGEYEFQIKTANDMAQWSQEVTTLKIIKKPSLIENNWFRLIAFISSCLLIYLFFKLYNYRVVKANSILKEEVTKRQKIEQDLKIVNAELLEKSKEMEQFAFVASHDLKEPLRTIGAFSSLLKRKYSEKLNDNGRQYLEHINQGVSRMYSLIESLLNYSSNKEANLVKEQVDLNRIINEVVQDLNDFISVNQAIVTINKLPPIFADPTQVRMLFTNFIKNGIKFNKSENQKVTIEEVDKQNANNTTIAVKDNGIGISKKDYENIFIIFKRLHSSSTYEGSGIGLALCKKIIERHQGSIWVESKEGQGSTFFIRFPNHNSLKQDGIIDSAPVLSA